jgi:hypothetical protein
VVVGILDPGELELRRLFRQKIPWALVLALESVGNNMAARMAMIATTTSSSMRVKAPACAARWSPRFAVRLGQHISE